MPRNLPAIRTPRKEKVWVTTRANSVSLTTNNVQVLADLLANYETDQGAYPRGSTAMRIVGTLASGNGSAATLSDQAIELFWGIAWVSKAVSDLAAADPAIPDPAEVGVREAQWIQRGVLMTKTVAGGNHRGADHGNLLSFARLDIKQMRKQPTADSRLVIITNNIASSAEAGAIWYDLNVMLGLS